MATTLTVKRIREKVKGVKDRQIARLEKDESVIHENNVLCLTVAESELLLNRIDELAAAVRVINEICQRNGL